MSKIDIPRYERIWLLFGGATLVVFLAILGIMGFGLGFHPSNGLHKTAAPETVTKTAPFDKPGLYPIGPNEYKAVMVAQMFTYFPGKMNIPAGSTVHFEVTSPDVVHGLEIPGTNVNLMVLPGHITEFTYTFRNAGDFLILCNEYCGAGHHVMMAGITVT